MPGLPDDRRFHLRGGILEVVLDHLDGELLLARRERVQGRLAAAQLGGQVVQGEPAEPLLEEQGQQPVEQLGLSAGTSPRNDCSHIETA